MHWCSLHVLVIIVSCMIFVSICKMQQSPSETMGHIFLSCVFSPFLQVLARNLLNKSLVISERTEFSENWAEVSEVVFVTLASLETCWTLSAEMVWYAKPRKIKPGQKIYVFIYIYIQIGWGHN